MIKKKIKQSLYMLADFVGTQVPAILILNMMDVAKNQGISINTKLLSGKARNPCCSDVCHSEKGLFTALRNDRTYPGSSAICVIDL